MGDESPGWFHLLESHYSDTWISLPTAGKPMRAFFKGLLASIAIAIGYASSTAMPGCRRRC